MAPNVLRTSRTSSGGPSKYCKHSREIKKFYERLKSGFIFKKNTIRCDFNTILRDLLEDVSNI